MNQAQYRARARREVDALRELDEKLEMEQWMQKQLDIREHYMRDVQKLMAQQRAGGVKSAGDTMAAMGWTWDQDGDKANKVMRFVGGDDD